MQTGVDTHGFLARLPSAEDDDLSARILDCGSTPEEKELLPMAMARLAPSDWAGINGLPG